MVTAVVELARVVEAAVVEARLVELEEDCAATPRARTATERKLLMATILAGWYVVMRCGGCVV